MRLVIASNRLPFTLSCDDGKGLINRPRSYDLFLRNNPQWHGKVVCLISVAPSRLGVET